MLQRQQRSLSGLKVVNRCLTNFPPFMIFPNYPEESEFSQHQKKHEHHWRRGCEKF